MKLDELRRALDGLAGPPPAADADARVSVARRVRRARRRARPAAATAVVATGALVVAGLMVAGHRPTSAPVTPRRIHTPEPTCGTAPPVVAASRVPLEVRRWAGGAPVIGGGSLWALHNALRVQPEFQHGTWFLKFPWYAIPAGIPTITAHRLDGAGSFRADGGLAYAATGVFVASGLQFSAAGCWQVTAVYRDSSLTFPITIPGTRAATSMARRPAP